MAVGQYGTYAKPLSGFNLSAQIVVHGPPRGELPLIFIGGGGITLEDPGATLQRVEVREGTVALAGVELAGGTMEQDIVGGNNGASPCTGLSGMIRNSVCESPSETPAAAFAASGSAPAPTTLTLRGDTLIGGTVYGHGDAAVAVDLSGGSAVAFDFTNVIARGAGGAVPDIYAKATGTTATLSLDHSNYAAVAAEGGATITPPGSPTDQTEPPQLSAEYGELGGPTIGAGITSEANGPFDLAGNGRTTPLNCEPAGPVRTDIGAYEYHPAALLPCPPFIEWLPRGVRLPDTRITSAKVNRKLHELTFSFQASGDATGFECRLVKLRHRPARRPYSTCASPKTYRPLRPGKYRFSARAFNSAGADPTPAAKEVKVS